MSDILSRIIWIGIGGALGANARFFIGAWVQERYTGGLPLATLIINLSGSFILGLFAILAIQRWELVELSTVRLAFAVGFLGAFTTFSAFEFELYSLAQSGAIGTALSYAILSVALGYVGVLAGVQLGRLLV